MPTRHREVKLVRVHDTRLGRVWQPCARRPFATSG